MRQRALHLLKAQRAPAQDIAYAWGGGDSDGGGRERSGKTRKDFASRAFGFYCAEAGEPVEGLPERSCVLLVARIRAEFISRPLCLHFTCQNVQTGSVCVWWVGFFFIIVNWAGFHFWQIWLWNVFASLKDRENFISGQNSPLLSSFLSSLLEVFPHAKLERQINFKLYRVLFFF